MLRHVTVYLKYMPSSSPHAENEKEKEIEEDRERLLEWKRTLEIQRIFARHPASSPPASS
jgi:hypothetical protein